jgi:hypothetical protein
LKQLKKELQIKLRTVLAQVEQLGIDNLSIKSRLHNLENLLGLAHTHGPTDKASAKLARLGQTITTNYVAHNNDDDDDDIEPRRVVGASELATFALESLMALTSDPSVHARDQLKLQRQLYPGSDLMKWHANSYYSTVFDDPNYQKKAPC